MVRKIIGGKWDRKNLANVNENFVELYDGANKIVELGKQAENTIKKADETLKKQRDVQSQLNSLVIESGNANAEVSQARGGHSVLNERLDAIELETSDTKGYAEKIAYQDLGKMSFECFFPFQFSNYIDIRTSSGNSYYYPQGLAVDKDYYYVLYSPSGSGDSTRIIVVLSKTDGTEVTKFYAGNAGGEDIHVEVEGTKRYLYAKSKASTLGKYDITELPEDMTKLTPVQEYGVGLFYNFAKIGDEWIIEQDSPTKRSIVTRELFSVYDSSLSILKRQFTIDQSIGGHWNGSYNMSTPKRQGITSHKGELVQIIGGNYYADTDPSEYHMQGALRLSTTGSVNANYTYDPRMLVNHLRNSGLTVDRIEHESAYSYGGYVYSIIVFNLSTNAEYANKRGVAIVKYGSKDPDLVIEEGNSVLVTHDKTFESYKTRTNGNFVNEFTGEVISTMKELLTYMIESGTMEIKFYSSAVSMIDVRGGSIPNGVLVTVENANSRSFWVEYQGVSTYEKFMVIAEPNNDVFTVYEQNITQYTKVIENRNLLTIKEDLDVFVKGATNIPPGVSSDGFVECRNTGSVGHIRYRPYNTSVTYIALYWGGSYKAWIKETSPTSV